MKDVAAAYYESIYSLLLSFLSRYVRRSTIRTLNSLLGSSSLLNSHSSSSYSIFDRFFLFIPASLSRYSNI